MDTLSLSLLRQISTQVAQGQIQEVRAAVPLEVSNFLLNKKRKDIHNLEEHYQLKIVVVPKEGLGPEEILVEYIKRESTEGKPAPEARPAAEPQTSPEPPKAGEPATGGSAEKNRPAPAGLRPVQKETCTRTRVRESRVPDRERTRGENSGSPARQRTRA